MLNLTSLKVVEKANSRGGSGAGKEKKAKIAHDFRFLRTVRKIEGVEKVRSLFFLTQEQFDKMGLLERGLIEVFDGTNFGLAVVSEEDAKFFKGRTTKDGTKGKKGLSINSNVFEKDLLSSGLLEDAMGAQYFNLSKIEGSDNFTIPGSSVVAIGGIYGLTKVGSHIADAPAAEAITETPTMEVPTETSEEEEVEEFEEVEEDDDL